MKKVLFETHHLYYWPNFIPIVEELKNRGGYTIHASMPRRSSHIQQAILSQACFDMDILFVKADSERDRTKKIIREAYDVIIVGNVGQLNQIILPDKLAVMVYHGIGLKHNKNPNSIMYPTLSETRYAYCLLDIENDRNVGTIVLGSSGT